MFTQELLGWLFVTSFILLVVLCAHPPAVLRRFLRLHLHRLGEWALRSMTPEPPPDPIADDLARVIRGERLRADLQRLQRLVATDEWMSATRQLGNRLAYEWVVRDLNLLRARMPSTAVEATSWSASSSGQVHELRSSYRPRPAAEVEYLDFGWKH